MNQGAQIGLFILSSNYEINHLRHAYDSIFDQL